MSSAQRLVVEVRCPSAEAEVVADHLLSLGASAVAEGDVSGGHAEDAGSTPDDVVVLTADLDAEGLGRFDWPGASIRVVDPGTRWLDAWREHAEVLRAGRFVVRPAWLPESAGGDLGTDANHIELVVEPGHTFGSGTHESTRMCLELLGDWVRPGQQVLDIGTGSGILAVGALLAGARHATGVDTDADSARVSEAVAAANGVAGRYRFAGATVPRGVFDVVLINMLINEIESLGPQPAESLAPGGIVVASGFLVEQVDRFVGLFRSSTVQVVETLEAGRWRAVVLASAKS